MDAHQGVHGIESLVMSVLYCVTVRLSFVVGCLLFHLSLCVNLCVHFMFVYFIWTPFSHSVALSLCLSMFVYPDSGQSFLSIS